jgi:hypothetical protein|tara:strand:+ start:233 stop:430 length:198 start_codon:yes stop_codon:yes gene_type:complete
MQRVQRVQFHKRLSAIITIKFVINTELIIHRLAEASFNIEKQGAGEPHRKNVYFVDPDGIEVEFV